MLTDEIRARMGRAMRERDAVAKCVLSVALGEIQHAENRVNRTLREDEQRAVLRKLVKANEETLSLAAAAGDERAPALRREIEILFSFLPPSLSVDETGAALTPVAEAVRSASNDGQAMGVAMKHLKATGTSTDAEAVRQAVARLRR